MPLGPSGPRQQVAPCRRRGADGLLPIAQPSHTRSSPWVEGWGFCVLGV